MNKIERIENLEKELAILKEEIKDDQKPVFPENLKDNRVFYMNAYGEVVEDPDGIEINQVSTISRAEAVIAMVQLLEWMDLYNEVEREFYGIKKEDIKEFSITCYSEEWKSHKFTILSFHKKETKDEFEKMFKHLIEEAKEVLVY